MNSASRLILATTAALVLAGASMAGAQAVIAPPTAQAAGAAPAATVTPADYDEEDEDEDEGWFQWSGHRGDDDDDHGWRGDDDGREGEDDDDDDDDDCQAGRGGDDDDDGGSCGMGMNAQPTTPPANGLFKDGAAPKAQMN